MKKENLAKLADDLSAFLVDMSNSRDYIENPQTRNFITILGFTLPGVIRMIQMLSQQNLPKK